MASSHEETAKPFQWLKVGKLTGHQLAKGMPWKVYLTEEDMTRLHEWLRRARRVRKQEVLIPTTFRDFDDYWSPFLGGQAPAPGYAMSLSEERRVALREQIRATLPIAPDGSIHLIARAWAVRGVR